MEAGVRSHVSPREICGGRSDTGTNFSSEYFGFTLPESFHQCFILILIYMLLLTRRTNGRSTGTFQEAVLFRKSGSIEQKSTFDFFFYSSIKLSWFWANSAEYLTLCRGLFVLLFATYTTIPRYTVRVTEFFVEAYINKKYSI